MAPGGKHADHDYIVARQERYIQAWRSGSPDEVMEFMDEDEFQYSNFASQHEDKSHAVVSDLLKATFDDHYDLEIETRSLHGHKHFTTWEWTMIFIPGLGPDGQKLSKQESKPVKLLGCTLMWWNDKDKIVKNHEYMQPREL